MTCPLRGGGFGGGGGIGSGTWGSSRATGGRTLAKPLGSPLHPLLRPLGGAGGLADDVELFLGPRPDVVPALELGGSLGRVSEEQVSNRLKLVSRLASGNLAQPPPAALDDKLSQPRAAVPHDSPVLITPIQALMQAVPAKSELGNLVRTLKVGDELEPEKLIVWLADHGYQRLDQVEVPGDFAVRGGIIDVYIPGEHPESKEEIGLTARIDFFGDQVESIKRFSLDSLGSLEDIKSLRLLEIG